MSNPEAANAEATNSGKAPVSRQSMKRSRRTQQASQPAANDNAPAAGSNASSSVEDTHALVVSSRRKRYTDNRPVDPSPITVAQTVRMAGNRPIQASPGMGAAAQPNLNESPQIMNRPIAPNTSPDEEEMLGYLD